MALNWRPFDEVESNKFKRYQNALLILYLDSRLDREGKLTPEDLKNAEKFARVSSHQYIELISQNWCFLRESGDQSVNNSKCCLTQLYDALDLDRDAVELAHKMKAYIGLRLYDQPDDKRLQIIDKLQNVFTRRADEVFTYGDISTFPRFFEVLEMEMSGIDALMSGNFFELQPSLKFLLRKRGPRIVLKIKKYYKNRTLGYNECDFCNSCEEEESDIKITKYVPGFKTADKLESFLALRFRQNFYTALRDFLPDMKHYFSNVFKK